MFPYSVLLVACLTVVRFPNPLASWQLGNLTSLTGKWKSLFLDDIGGGAFLPTSTQTNLTKFINGLFIYVCFFEHNKLFSMIFKWLSKFTILSVQWRKRLCATFPKCNSVFGNSRHGLESLHWHFGHMGMAFNPFVCCQMCWWLVMKLLLMMMIGKEQHVVLSQCLQT